MLLFGSQHSGDESQARVEALRVMSQGEKAALVHKYFRVMQRAGIISFALAALVNAGWAQQSSAPSSSSQGSSSQSYASDTPEDVQANIDELSKQLIPDKDVLLLRELDHLDGEIARVTQQLTKANSWRDEQNYFNAVANRFKAQSQTIAQFDCQNNLAKFRDAALSYTRAYSELQSYYGNMGDSLDFPLIALPPFVNDDQKFCIQSKSKILSQEYSDAEKQILDNLQKALTTFLTTQTNIANAETKYLDALKKRRSAVQEKLNASQPAFQIGSNLWLILLILAAACVLTILGIKLFDADLQMEWVASGQVIQFVTVMILLSVILALGLSAKISENTLGTLLGGIAGYVLAQGVGRSAARNVERATAALPPGTARTETPPTGAAPATPS
jgi:hypothetical protein